MQLPVQNQIPCAGSFGCQRIHVALNKHDEKLDRLEETCFMEKLITRKEAAEILGISIATLDAARNNGLISYVQYVQNGCVYFSWPSGVYRKMHPQSKASRKERNLS